MNAQHTPGPWKVADASYGWDHFAAIVQAKPGGQLIGTCHLAALSRDYTQSAADARLIAEAPEFLLLLQEAAEFIQPFNRAEDLSDRIEAAIARAKGEAA